MAWSKNGMSFVRCREPGDAKSTAANLQHSPRDTHRGNNRAALWYKILRFAAAPMGRALNFSMLPRSEEHTSELQSRGHLVCRLLLEKKKKKKTIPTNTRNISRHPQ